MKVSVITSLYNYAKYIDDCIRSFLKQDFIESELIIVDDGSQDNPYKIIKNYIGDRVKYFNLGQNYGYSYAKNFGIKNSSSDIIVMLDADDMLTKNGISSRYNVITKGYDFVHGRVLNLKNNEKSESKLWRQWSKSNKDSSCYKFVHAQGVMLLKKIHREIGLYDITLRCKSDREMWARIFNRNYSIGWTEDSVSIYRIHNKQMSKSSDKLQKNDLLQKNVLKKIEKRKTDLSDLEMLN